jgi:hypothetical protein
MVKVKKEETNTPKKTRAQAATKHSGVDGGPSSVSSSASRDARHLYRDAVRGCQEMTRLQDEKQDLMRGLRINDPFWEPYQAFSKASTFEAQLNETFKFTYGTSPEKMTRRGSITTIGRAATKCIESYRGSAALEDDGVHDHTLLACTDRQKRALHHLLRQINEEVDNLSLHIRELTKLRGARKEMVELMDAKDAESPRNEKNTAAEAVVAPKANVGIFQWLTAGLNKLGAGAVLGTGGSKDSES